MRPRPETHTPRIGQDHGGSETQKLSIITCNIEGCKTNANYLQSLDTDNSILCLQEHFLWDFEKHELDNILPTMDNHTRCHDSSNPVSAFKLPKGRAGVSILWPKRLSNITRKLDVGNERIVAVTMAASVNLCIVNAYLPTHNQSEKSHEEYHECLDILHDIFQQYESTHKIVICGDLNGTLLQARNYNKHDKLLQCFVSEHSLEIPVCGDKPTFIHHNGMSQSQIDYILCRETQLISKYTIYDSDAINLSAHMPVQAHMNVNVPEQKNRTKHRSKTSTRKLQWENANNEHFCASLDASLSSCFHEKGVDPSTKSQLIIDCLHKSTSAAVPSKLIMPKGPRWKISPNVKLIRSQCKLNYSAWQMAGRPANGELYINKQLSKKQLRRQVRQEKCLERKDFYNQIMSNPSSKLFYRLISRNKPKNSATACIDYGGESHFNVKEQRGCFASYYEDLAVPKDNDYDNHYQSLCHIRHDIVNELYSDEAPSLEPVTPAEVEQAINKLNTGKAADEFDISSEHFKVGKSVLLPYLCDTFTDILKSRTVPDSFKSGILTPVLKKGKDPTLTDSYRGITVTAVIGKVLEYVLLGRLKTDQSSLQYGFTKGLSPTMASLLISEAKAEIKNRSVPTSIYLATLDAQKAFDVVDHVILLDKLYNQSIHPDLWLIVKNMYEGLTTRVKWAGELSGSFAIGQGVRQGGVLSTELYKVYINSLLEELEQNSVGLHIGNIYIGCPTCADDVALLSTSQSELQTMLNVACRYSKQHRYMLHPSKSKVITTSKSSSNEKWTVYDNDISASEQTVHLGLIRAASGESNLNISERISLARRTMYSLIKTGLHGTNGLNPKVSYRIYQAYVLPRLLFGLEVLQLTNPDLDSLKRFHHNSLRMFQSLPQRTAIGALHLLLGALPISAELHRRQLSFLYLVLSCDNIAIQDLVTRQIAVNLNNAGSFFCRVSYTLTLYQLPSLTELNDQLPTKFVWKTLVSKHIHAYWTNRFISESTEKSSLSMMNIPHLRTGITHHIWDSLDSTVTEVRKGITRARMITGTYMLQTNKCKFSHFQIDPTCPLCRLEPEDIVHVLTRCPEYHKIRKSYIPKINKEVSSILGSRLWTTESKNRTTFTKVILDSNHLYQYKEVINATRLNRLSIELCDKIHLQRILALNVMAVGNRI
ncbi:MAG: reverse transcriptase domain-containing protein [Sedimenticola sp.]